MEPSPIRRTNDEWLVDLQASGRRKEFALEDLRRIITHGLPYALSKWILPSDPRFSSLVEEVSQETILRVLSKLDTFEGRSQFTTWVQAIAVRIALTELRLARWREISLDEHLEKDDLDGMDRELPSSDPGVEKSFEKNEILNMLGQTMESVLTEKQRKAMLAVAVKGMPLEVVARRMGTNRNALYKLLHDARLKLKGHLEKNGLSPSEILAMFEE